MLRKLQKFSLPEIEEKILQFWKEHKIFEKSLEQRAHGKKFVFYEGPPTANGRPGIHHVLARAFKDVIPRYRTMRGYFVSRKGGWDTHGLPVELEVEKKLGLNSKKDIEKYGIGAFNAKCKESVWTYKDEWERLTERIGFWLDMRHPYITYENSYIETLWWILKRVWERGLLYKGHKVVAWCTRCGTALSSHEIALGYREVEETSVYIKFKLKKGQSVGRKAGSGASTYVLSWTTTPWTLPGNVALAVGANIEYSVVNVGEGKKKEIYILATNRLSVLKDPHTVVASVKGKDLVGLAYEPLFSVEAFKKSSAAYKIYPAKFVGAEDGTGVVHTAVMYGEDDYNLGKEVGLPQHHTVDLQGKFTSDVPAYAGMYVKAKETEKKIVDDLEKKGLLLRTEPYKHDYPFCWRCDTPLLYYARDSWFIAMSKFRKELLRENKKIRWVPESVKEGRFGEWLREVKDWAISRERYWGTPLPLWECKKCGGVRAVGGYEELSQLQGGAKNRYILMRHGEPQNILMKKINSSPAKRNVYPLTLKGRVIAERSAKKLKKENIDIIVASDFRRTRETAEIVASELGIKKIIFEKKFREINTGIFDGKKGEDYHAYFSSYAEKFTKRTPKGESLRDLAKRVYEGLETLEKKYEGKTILVVSHEYPVWMMQTVMSGWGEERAITEKEKRGNDFIETTEFRKVPFLKLPRNGWNFADPHRPYVDDVTFPCEKCHERMTRIPEVADVWFDSGAMPFAQAHYPFAKEKIDFPADYISEAVDQTRGWFYTLLAESILLDKTTPYKNVICLGHVLDKNGQKMSKSKGNAVDAWGVIAKYGADAVRWYLFTVNPPGEPKKFDEAELGKTLRQFVLMVYHSFIFYETYAKKFNFPLTIGNPKHVLDRWILARLEETTKSVTKAMDAYNPGTAGRTIEIFTGDLSRWYIRRSRRRLQKPETQADHEAASKMLGHCLYVLSQLLAPFMPFFSEALYKSLVSEGNKTLSVHLTDWPKMKKALTNEKLIKGMTEIREFASLALAKRAEAAIKVRQPLQMLRVKTENNYLWGNKELMVLLSEEVNVKNAYVDNDIKRPIELDIRVTPALKEEGLVREFIRLVQDLRQDAKLEPKNRIVIHVECKELIPFIEKNRKNIGTEVNAKAIEYKRVKRFTVELETKFEEWPLWIALRKVE
ncbi:MAG: class I tRNA ligase family protein [Patescibacteria group bacterium]